RRDDVGRRQVRRQQAVALELDVDLAIHAAPNLDRAYTRHLLEAADDVAFENARQLRHRPLRARTDDYDGQVVGVELADTRRVDLRRQVLANAVERGAHVVGGLVEVGALREAQLNVAPPHARPGDDLLELRHAGDGVLDALGDDELHLLGADVAVTHLDVELWKLQRRQQIDGQVAEADEPEQHHDQVDHG